MTIAFFDRTPRVGLHSIERVFATVRSLLPPTYYWTIVATPTPADSRMWLLSGLWRAWKSRASVNHVVGDVHYVALGLPSSNTIVTVHDTYRLDQLSGLRKLLYRQLYFALPLRRCAAVTAISEHTRDRLIDLFPFVSDKISVIPDCLPPGFARHPKTFNTKCPVILQIGTRPNKNLERLCTALAGRQCTLHIVGHLSATQRHLLVEMNLPYHHSPSLTDVEMIAAYDRADVVTFVSTSEGFGMPILEAQAVGRPVITSRLSPMSEVAGPGACLVDPFDVADIARGLDHVLSDANYRRDLVEAGFDNVARFRATDVTQQYVALYTRLGRRGTD